MQTNALVIQLKFHSISQKPFKALKIRINTYDVSHILLPDVVEYQYLDINITAGEKFGSNKAILLKNSVVRSFEIQEYSVVYSDNTVKTVHSPFEMLPLSKTLKQEFSNNELENQYRIETVGQAMYVPMRYGKLWKCTCGEWNKDNICSGCKSEEEIVFKRFNIELLTEHMEKRLAERKIIREREAKLAAEKKKELEEARKIELAKKQKQTKIGLCAAAIIAVVLIFVYKIYPNFIEPSMSYNHAKKMLSEKKYDDAVAEFEKLGSYKDAENMALQAKYDYAKNLLSNKKYDDAISIFEELEKYKDSEDMIKKSTYEKANDFLKNGDYKKAKAIFESLGNQEMVVETICQEVSDLLTEKEYEKAKTILGNVSDSIKKTDKDIQKLIYQLASIYKEKKDYSVSAALFKDIKDYKDSLSKWGECEIQLGKMYILSENDETEIVKIFEQVINEDSTPKNVKEAKKCLEEYCYQKGNQLLKSREYQEALNMFSYSEGYKDTKNKIQFCKKRLKMKDLVSLFNIIEFEVSPDEIQKQFGKASGTSTKDAYTEFPRKKYEQYIYEYKDCCAINGFKGNVNFIFEKNYLGNLELVSVEWRTENNAITDEVYDKILEFLENIWGESKNILYDEDFNKINRDNISFLLCDEWPEKNYSTYFTRDEKNGIGKNTILEITAERKEIDW